VLLLRKGREGGSSASKGEKGRGGKGKGRMEGKGLNSPRKKSGAATGFI